MPFPYEEFDLSDVRTYPLKSRQSKARVEDFARPLRPARRSARLSIRCRTSSRPPTSRRSSRAIVDARRNGRRHRLGARRARHQDRARPDADRSDGARIRVGDRDQRRGDHSRFRDRARRRDVGGRRRSARAGPVRHGGGDRAAVERRDHRRRRRGLGIGQAVDAVPRDERSRSTRAAACWRPRRGSAFR